MRRNLNLNCTNIKTISKKTLDNAKEFKSISNEINNIISEVDKCWTGYDSSIFKKKVITFVTQLKNEADYLEGWSSFLSTSSDIYSDNVDSFYPVIASIRSDLSSIKYNK